MKKRFLSLLRLTVALFSTVSVVYSDGGQFDSVNLIVGAFLPTFDKNYSTAIKTMADEIYFNDNTPPMSEALQKALGHQTQTSMFPLLGAALLRVGPASSFAIASYRHFSPEFLKSFRRITLSQTTNYRSAAIDQLEEKLFRALKKQGYSLNMIVRDKFGSFIMKSPSPRGRLFGHRWRINAGSTIEVLNLIPIVRMTEGTMKKALDPDAIKNLKIEVLSTDNSSLEVLKFHYEIREKVKSKNHVRLGFIALDHSSNTLFIAVLRDIPCSVLVSAL